MEVDIFCARHAVVVPWHAQNVIVCTDLAGEVQDSRWTQHEFLSRKERTAMNSLVPFLPVPQGRIGLRRRHREVARK